MLKQMKTKSPQSSHTISRVEESQAGGSPRRHAMSRMIEIDSTASGGKPALMTSTTNCFVQEILKLRQKASKLWIGGLKTICGHSMAGSAPSWKVNFRRARRGLRLASRSSSQCRQPGSRSRPWPNSRASPLEPDGDPVTSMWSALA